MRPDLLRCGLNPHVLAIRHRHLWLGVSEIKILDNWYIGIVCAYGVHYRGLLFTTIRCALGWRAQEMELTRLRSTDKHTFELAQYPPLTKCSKDPPHVVGCRYFF